MDLTIDIFIKKRWHDYEEELNFLQNLYAYITQNSILWNYLKNKTSFFEKEVLMDQYFTFTEEQRKQLAKNKIIKYEEAKLLYKKRI